MPEPERIPIEDPRVRGRYRSIENDFSTIHRGVDGNWYKIHNSSSIEADNRLHKERMRNDQLGAKEEVLRLRKLLEEKDRLPDEIHGLSANEDS